MAIKPSEKVAVVATIDPDAYAAGTYLSDWVDIGKWQDGLLAVVMAGDLGTSATLDAKLRQATDASGSNAKDIGGKAITQLSQAGSDSDKQALVQVLAAELDLSNGFRFVALSMTLGVATSDAGAALLGCGPHYGPASESVLASVDEIVG
jgi:hypothetical protein